MDRWLPTNKTVEEEREQLERHLVDSTAALEVVKSESNRGIDLLEQQSSTVGDTMRKVENALELMKDTAEERDEELVQLREELLGIKETLPKVSV